MTKNCAVGNTVGSPFAHILVEGPGQVELNVARNISKNDAGTKPPQEVDGLFEVSCSQRNGGGRPIVGKPAKAHASVRALSFPPNAYPTPSGTDGAQERQKIAHEKTASRGLGKTLTGLELSVS